MVVIVLLVPMFIAEVVLRMTQYGSMAFWQPDPVYGKALIAGGEAWYTNEGKAFVRINDKGFHDQNHQISKPDDVFRIAVLGDSFVEAVQLPYTKSFWYLLSRKLQNCSGLSGKSVETMGFGVSNYGTGHQLLMLRNEVLQYQPDQVVLGFFQGNDIIDNSSFYYSGPSPLFSIKNNELVVDNSFAEEPGFKKRLWLSRLGYYRLILEFRVLELIRNSIKLIPGYFKTRQPAQIRRADDGLIEPKREQKHEQEFEKAQALTKKLIKQFAHEVKQANAGFTLLSIPHSSLLLPDRDETSNPRFLSRLENSQQIDKTFSEFAQQQNISTVNLSQELKPYSEDTDHYLYGFENSRLGFGHFSEYGHERIAQVLAERLCKRLKSF